MGRSKLLQAQRETLGQEAPSRFPSRVTGAGNRRTLHIRIRRRDESAGGHAGLVGGGARCASRARDGARHQSTAQNRLPVFAKSPARPTVGGLGFRRTGRRTPCGGQYGWRANSTEGEKAGMEKKAGMSKNTKIVLGAVGGAVVIGGIGALAAGGGGGGSSGGGDDGGSVSRSSPTP